MENIEKFKNLLKKSFKMFLSSHGCFCDDIGEGFGNVYDMFNESLGNVNIVSEILVGLDVDIDWANCFIEIKDKMIKEGELESIRLKGFDILIYFLPDDEKDLAKNLQNYEIERDVRKNLCSILTTLLK